MPEEPKPEASEYDSDLECDPEEADPEESEHESDE